MSTATAPPSYQGGRALAALGYGDDLAPWIRELVDRFMSGGTPRCKHLRRRPSRSGLLFADEGFARCMPCAAVHVDAIQEPPAGAFGAAADSRVKCGACQGQFSVEQVTPLCILAPPWVLYVGLCAPCEAREGVVRDE